MGTVAAACQLKTQRCFSGPGLFTYQKANNEIVSRKVVLRRRMEHEGQRISSVPSSVTSPRFTSCKVEESTPMGFHEVDAPMKGKARRYGSKFPVGKVTCLDAEDLQLLHSSLVSCSPIIEVYGYCNLTVTI